MATPADYTMGTSEAAKALGLSVNALQRWTDEGRIPCLTTPGGFRRYRPEDVEAFAATMLPDQPAAAK